MQMAKEDCNCFVKQHENSPWVPAVHKPDGGFATPGGYSMLDNPFAIRDATYADIIAEMSTRGEIFLGC